jgi:hypothetical protein
MSTKTTGDDFFIRLRLIKCKLPVAHELLTSFPTGPYQFSVQSSDGNTGPENDKGT